MKERSKSGIVTLEYLDKYQDMPHKTMAKLMHKERPKLFVTLEQARSSIRYYKGRNGTRNRGELAVRDYALPAPTEDNPHSLPLAEDENFKPYIVGPTQDRVLVLADIHIPHHDVHALTLALQVGKDFGANTIILNGDFLDMHSLSSFVKDPEAADLPKELEMGRHMLYAIRKQFPDAKIIMKEGNHEDRMGRYLSNKAPELLRLTECRLDVLLRLMDVGADWVDRKQPIYFGHLNILHGHEMAGAGSSVNPARSMYLKAMACVLSAHNHQTSQQVGKTLRDTNITCWTQGALCQLHPQFMPYNKWNLGFTLLERTDGDNFMLYPKRIINGEVC